MLLSVSFWVWVVSHFFLRSPMAFPESVYPIVSKVDNSNNNSGYDRVCSLLRTYWCGEVNQLAPDHLITSWQSQDLNPELFGLWLPLYTTLLSWQITKITIYSVNKDLLTSPLPGIVAGNTMVSERWILSLELINLMGKRANQIVTHINRKPHPDLVLGQRSVMTKVIQEEEVVMKLINEGWVSVD